MRPLSGPGYLMLAMVAAGAVAWLRAAMLHPPKRQRVEREVVRRLGIRRRGAALVGLFALPGAIAALLLLSLLDEALHQRVRDLPDEFPIGIDVRDHQHLGGGAWLLDRD